MRFILIGLCCWHLSGFSQVGVLALGTFPQNRIKEISSGQKLFSVLYGGGVDYWFRLKNYRLEFYPSINYQFSTSKLDVGTNAEHKLIWKVLDFAPRLQFYPFDFRNDCLCPTFSKQGQFFKKGFFLQLSPGLGFSNLSILEDQARQSKESYFFGRAGAGIDIGISDLLTLSPSVNYQFSQALDWSLYFQNQSSASLNLLNGLFMSVRLGLRMDNKR